MNTKSYTIKSLAAAANTLTEEAGIELDNENEITPEHVATWLEVLIDEVGADAPVDAESAADYLSGHREWVDAHEAE